MADLSHYQFNASDRSYFAVIKKDIHALGATLSFSENRLGEVDIVVAELLSNLAKYARNGRLLVKLVTEGTTRGIEIISIDEGPGITDVAKVMGDGYSTSNTLGHGLGSVKRLSDQFQVYSLKDWGTIILTRLFVTPVKIIANSGICIRSIVIPKPGETACGDGFYQKVSKEKVKLMLGDGLGHGPEAALAVQTAMEAFKICPDDDPCEIIKFINASVRKTRGLVATVAIYDAKTKEWLLCGIGNIATRMQSATGTKSHIAYNGIIGMNLPRTLNNMRIVSERNQYLIFCSDGIKTKWEISRWPGILRYDPSILAAAIYKDHARHTDDMSVAICKVN